MKLVNSLFWRKMIKYKVNDKSNIVLDNNSIYFENNECTHMVCVLENQSPRIAKINIPLSSQCNMQCSYCIENHDTKNIKVMDIDFAKYAIREFVKLAIVKGFNSIQLSFDYGGEPMCEPLLFSELCTCFLDNCGSIFDHKIIQVTTNASWSDNELALLSRYATEIIVSLDGYEELNNANRKLKNGRNCFSTVNHNAKIIYQSGKLRHFNCVITKDSIEHYKGLLDFFTDNFPNSTVKLSPVKIDGAATKNGFERVSVREWNEFMIQAYRHIVNKPLFLIDAHPKRKVSEKYCFGCEHLEVPNWFCWFDGSVSCCTDRKDPSFKFAYYNNRYLEVDYQKLNGFSQSNFIENITLCASCIAKYYCAGNCPKFRETSKINCLKRRDKFAKLVMEKYRNGC